MDWLIALLTWLSADPSAVEKAAPRAAAAAEVAYASMTRERVEGEKQAAPAGKGNCPSGKCPPRQTVRDPHP